MREDPPVRVEHFALELADLATGAVRSAGVALWRRRVDEGRVQLELECHFFDQGSSTGGVHIAHVEQLSVPGARLVWREWGDAPGRCLVADWSADGRALRTYEWSRDDPPRETHSTCEGAVMPLYLMELAREGKATSGRFSRFDPLARRLEPVDLKTSYGPAEAPAVRTVRLERPDGTLAGLFRFKGVELQAFQWQDGPLRARRVTADQYALALERRP